MFRRLAQARAAAQTCKGCTNVCPTELRRRNHFLLGAIVGNASQRTGFSIAAIKVTTAESTPHPATTATAAD
jgi:hypothetical protein